MPECLAPSVYVEERPSQPTPIEGVQTSIVGFVDLCQKGPIKKATLVTGLGGFERAYGRGRGPDYTWHAVTQADLDQGRLVGVAVVRPDELVIFRIGRWTADRPASPAKRRRWAHRHA